MMSYSLELTVGTVAQVRLPAPGARVVIVLDAEAGPVRAAAVVRGRAIAGVQVILEDPGLTNNVTVLSTRPVFNNVKPKDWFLSLKTTIKSCPLSLKSALENRRLS